MAETHPVGARADGGPPARPFKPYVYGGETEEPPAVRAARERHQAVTAEIERRSAALAAAQTAANDEGGGDGHA